MGNDKINVTELDIAGLLSLKTFERPDEARIEKNIKSTMQAVRVAHKSPSLLLFPDKSTAWMFAQPRYGVAALFILFLGLQLMNPPMPVESVGSAVVKQPELAAGLREASSSNTVSTAILPVPARRQENFSSLIQPVSLAK
jgi:hypothetical protein